MPTGIYKRTIYHKDKIRNGLNDMVQKRIEEFGYVFNEQQRKNMGIGTKKRIKKLGYRYTEEQKKKISKTLTDKPSWKVSKSGKSRSTIAKQNNFGRWMKGKEISEETKEKLRSNKHTEEWKKKMSKKMKGHFVSQETRNKLKGKNCHFWKGGVTPLNKSLRTISEYKLWRTDVFERDEFICQDCNIKGGKLNADHIKPFSIIIEENNIKTVNDALNCKELWNINNGRTLCSPCHLKTDTFAGGAKKYQ